MHRRQRGGFEEQKQKRCNTHTKLEQCVRTFCLCVAALPFFFAFSDVLFKTPINPLKCFSFFPSKRDTQKRLKWFNQKDTEVLSIPEFFGRLPCGNIGVGRKYARRCVYLARKSALKIIKVFVVLTDCFIVPIKSLFSALPAPINLCKQAPSAQHGTNGTIGRLHCALSALTAFMLQTLFRHLYTTVAERCLIYTYARNEYRRPSLIQTVPVEFFVHVERNNSWKLKIAHSACFSYF